MSLESSLPIFDMNLTLTCRHCGKICPLNNYWYEFSASRTAEVQLLDSIRQAYVHHREEGECSIDRKPAPGNWSSHAFTSRTALLFQSVGPQSPWTRLLVANSHPLGSLTALLHWLRMRDIPLSAKLTQLLAAPYRLSHFILTGKTAKILTYTYPKKS